MTIQAFFLELNSLPCLALLALTHILLMRFFPRLGLMYALIIAFAAGIVCLITINWLNWNLFLSVADFTGIFAANLLIYVCCSYCYTDFLMLGESALRFRIINEISFSGSGLTEQEIKDKYDERVILRLRLNRLINNGYLAEHNGRLWLKKRNLLLLAGIIKLARRIVFARSLSSRPLQE